MCQKKEPMTQAEIEAVAIKALKVIVENTSSFDEGFEVLLNSSIQLLGNIQAKTSEFDRRVAEADYIEKFAVYCDRLNETLKNPVGILGDL